MATLQICTDSTAVICLNGGFIGTTSPEKPLTVPLPMQDSLFTAYSCGEDSVINCFITCNGTIRLASARARLCRWSDDIYELIISFEKEKPLPPPIILKEQEFRGGCVGLCGGYLVYRKSDGSTVYHPSPADNFEIFHKYILLFSKGRVTVLTQDLTEVLTEPCNAYKLGTALELSFTPGDMDFFTVTRSFSPELKLIATRTESFRPETVSDRIRCFCQAVRLGIEDVFASLVTIGLKSESTLDDVRNFMGVFDQTDTPRYLSSQSENTVALRYKVDENNFHYMCYKFKIDTTTGIALIDDVEEL